MPRGVGAPPLLDVHQVVARVEDDPGRIVQVLGELFGRDQHVERHYHPDGARFAASSILPALRRPGGAMRSEVALIAALAWAGGALAQVDAGATGPAAPHRECPAGNLRG